MDSIFKEAGEFNRTYDILLTKFLDSNFKILTEDTDENAVDSLSTAFKNFKTFTHKFTIWQKEFNFRMKIARTNIKTKNNVNFILKILYHLPPETKIKFPNLIAIAADAKDFYKRIDKIANELFRYNMYDWIDSTKAIDMIYKMDDLCEEYRELIDRNFNQKREITVREAFTIVTEIFYDPLSYFDFNAKYIHVFTRISEYINKIAPKIENYCRTSERLKNNIDGINKMIELLKYLSNLMKNEYLFSDTVWLGINDSIHELSDILSNSSYTDKSLKMKKGELKNWDKYTDRVYLLDAKHRSGELDNESRDLLKHYWKTTQTDEFKKAMEKFK